MKTRITLALVVVTFLLAAAPASAAAASDKVNPGVAVALEAAGPGEAVPVFVVAPGQARRRAREAAGRRRCRRRFRSSAPSPPGSRRTRSRRSPACRTSPTIVADNPVYGIGVGRLGDGRHQPRHRPRRARRAAGRRTERRRRHRGDPRQRHRRQHRPRRRAGSSAGSDLVKGKKHPYDDAGHGTFVAGLIAGDGTASLPLEDGGLATTQFRGVAPAADVVAVKVLDRFGQGRASTVIAGIAWAIAHKDELGIRVLNISIGGNPSGPVAEDPLAQAVEAAWDAGIVVVCAAGNEGEFGLGGVPLPRQRSRRDHGRRDRHAPDRRPGRRRRVRLQLDGADALRRDRQARPRRARATASSRCASSRATSTGPSRRT